MKLRRNVEFFVYWFLFGLFWMGLIFNGVFVVRFFWNYLRS